MIITEQIAENRRKVVAALREADESKRLVGTSLEFRGSEEEAREGKVCACAVAAIALNLPLLVPKKRTSSTEFNYRGVEKALGIGGISITNVLVNLNDESISYERELYPVYTWNQIAEKLERESGWV